MHFHEYVYEIIFRMDHYINELVKSQHCGYLTMQKLQYWDEISSFVLLMIFPYFFNIFINIHEYANYANTITCIVDNQMKSLVCL